MTFKNDICWCLVFYSVLAVMFVSLSLTSVKSRLVLPFRYRLTWVVLEKGPLNGCVCVCPLVVVVLWETTTQLNHSRLCRQRILHEDQASSKTRLVPSGSWSQTPNSAELSLPWHINHNNYCQVTVTWWPLGHCQFTIFSVHLPVTVGCHYFLPGPQLPSQPLRRLLPVSLLGEQRHDGCEQFA